MGPTAHGASTGYPGAMYRTGPSALLARAGFRVITYDHRGIGGSDKPDEPYTTRMFAQDASGLLQALGITQAHVLGHSMGGRVAQWMALDDPERVRSLVLVASGAGQAGTDFALTKGLALNEALKLIERATRATSGRRSPASSTSRPPSWGITLR